VPHIIDTIIGWSDDASVAARLHELAHRGAVDYVHIDAHDLERKRLRVTSASGVDYAVVLPRHQQLADGAVLVLEHDRAVVVRAGAPQYLRLRANDTSAALRLGFLAGHLHWKVDQRGDTLVVHLDGPPQDCTARIADLLATGQVEPVDD